MKYANYAIPETLRVTVCVENKNVDNRDSRNYKIPFIQFKLLHVSSREVYRHRITNKISEYVSKLGSGESCPKERLSDSGSEDTTRFLHGLVTSTGDQDSGPGGTRRLASDYLQENQSSVNSERTFSQKVYSLYSKQTPPDEYVLEEMFGVQSLVHVSHLSVMYLVSCRSPSLKHVHEHTNPSNGVCT